MHSVCADVPSVHVGAGRMQITCGESIEFSISLARFDSLNPRKGNIMNSIVYIVGAVVIIVAILSFFGLR